MNLWMILKVLALIFSSDKAIGNSRLLPQLRKFSSQTRNHQWSDCCCRIQNCGDVSAHSLRSLWARQNLHKEN